MEEAVFPTDYLQRSEELTIKRVHTSIGRGITRNDIGSYLKWEGDNLCYDAVVIASAHRLA